MRVLATIAAALLLTSCNSHDAPKADDQPGNATATMNPAFAPKPTPSPTKFPLPDAQPTGMVNPEAAPDVAAHIARQERCAHWRSEQQGSTDRPEVVQGMTRECKGIDAELASLRKTHDADGAATALLRPFRNVER